MFLVGLTGGIGAGKTSALREFALLGAVTLEADAIVHGLYAPGAPACRALHERWGTGVMAPDGGVDRAAVARLVFGSDEELAWLNRLIHPEVRRIIRRRAEQLDVALFCAIPLLFEAGWQRDTSVIVAVWCDSATQRGRLLSRGWTSSEIDGRLAHQQGMDEKLGRADYGIINTSSRGCLHEQCRRVFQSITSRRVRAN